ncbi:MAG: chemotaxis protein CheA [Desulfatiglans sp.]|jgi:two-component system chemotaxis sensor kinase CheA|nr:chemotaxis protein CheA [Desulfatiglans sp.]
MPDLIDKADKILEEIALGIVTMEGEDIAALGDILNSLAELENELDAIAHRDFSSLTLATKGYIEKMIMREVDDPGPLEDAIAGLQVICRSIRNQEDYTEDIAPVLAKLGHRLPDEKEETEMKNSPDQAGDENRVDETKSSEQELTDDDREIIADFVMESLESLGTIEVNLMDLEQDPDDLDTINTIFRPFHTIKGVSAFINLEKINKLAHSTENLLDKARNGEIRIENGVVDLILESTDMLKNMIQGVQEGMEKGTSLDSGHDIAPLKERIDGILTLADQMKDKPVGEILLKEGAITDSDLEEALEKQKKEPDKRIGEILMAKNKVASKEVVSALREQKRFRSRHIELQVKVDTKKLDNLVDLTGELVIAQSMLRQNRSLVLTDDQEFLQNLGQLNQITSALQTTAMSMRMVPIKNTFHKMVRLVRDLAKNSNKMVNLVMSGEDTEIDRNVVEELYDPMVHMIRNSVDHGIESPDERERAGKSQKGTVMLRAYHKGGNIVVEIEDDGKGLDRERILEKAKSSNLVTDESKMTESEIFNMIFQPGFSTAKEVTDVSGRGVGMDVVKKSIEKLRGRVEIKSRPGQGSTFIISLPLTLAIIEGMLVRVGQEKYVIPALAILESFRPERGQYSTVEGKGEMILTRGHLLPLIRLDRLFGIQADSVNPWNGLVVAVEYENERMCLMLDELLGKEEVVIKSLGGGIKDVQGITGGAILGDGRVGLILDMAGIFQLAKGG